MDTSILVVEDDANDVLLLQFALEEARLECAVHFVTDGRQAIDYLAGHGRFRDRTRHPLPSLVLLDLKLPIIMGFDVLRWLRSQPDLRSLRVVIFSSSNDRTDIARAYQLGADAYFVKPLATAARVEFARQLKRCFLGPVPLRCGEPDPRCQEADCPRERPKR